jgi:uncharacterized protein (DUF427 family)
MLGGEIVVNTTNPLLVWEVPYYPTYYFLEADVRTDLLVETGETRKSPSRGEATQFTVKANGAEGAAYTYKDPKIDAIAGHYAFVWKTIGSRRTRRSGSMPATPTRGSTYCPRVDGSGSK